MNLELKKYFSILGKKGGSVKSESKSISSKKNGMLGGRPKNEIKEDKT